MRHYRIGSSRDDMELVNCGGLSYTAKPLIVLTSNSTDNHSGGISGTTVVASCCRGHKFRVIALFMAFLLVVQYLFGASIYNVRIFDYNIAQIYVWTGATNLNDQKTKEANWEEYTTTNSKKINETNSTIIRTNTGEMDESPTTIDATSFANWFTSNSTILASGVEFSSLENMSINTATIIPNSSLPVCPMLPPVLVGPIKVWFDYPSYEELEKIYPDLDPGGHGKPQECISRHKVAIIIPYRDRDKHLRGFLHNMHSLLRKQQLDYAIYAVEQVANQTFNRAKLMNVGFVEATKQYDWQCAIFHDVDLLPEDDRNIYSCPDQPRHMSVAVDKFAYKLPYVEIFGGISALKVEHFRTLNGFSNDYWGWGGEDDDMASRVKIHHYQITRYRADIARYKMIKHVSDKQNPINPCRYNLMYKVKQRWMKDGLSNLNYKVISLEKTHLFTRVLVDLLETESKQQLANENVCASGKKG